MEASSESTVEAGLSSPPVIGVRLTSYELMSICRRTGQPFPLRVEVEALDVIRLLE